ncbi:DUF2194 domain-containing protein [Bacillus salitolerans]|uniref:DUF2194 domain-containing protein n=1 Tax=Bacillus salitolerans TaxID=1437434 RepID=A0ABW4LK63_9BACI
MMKHSRRLMMIVLGMTFLLIVTLQFLKPEVLYRIFTISTKNEFKVELMSDESDHVPNGEELMVYIIGEAFDVENSLLLENISYSLHYSKIRYGFIKANQINELEATPYNVVMLTGGDASHVKLEDITRFVDRGGSLYISSRFYDPNWASLLGIEENFGYFPEPSYGIHFETTFFPGYPNVASDESSISNSMLDLTLNEKANVYIRSEETPLLWTFQYGEGTVLYWNGTFLTDKLARGLITHSLSLLIPSFVSGQAAIKVMFIDDFPSPVPFGTAWSIKRDYGLSTEKFYKQVWWPDMKRLGEKYRFLYTNVLIGTYRDDMELSADELITSNDYHMVYYGRDSLRNGHEVGLHGYNHQSLVLESESTNPQLGYVPWPSQESMEESIRRAREMFLHFFPGSTLTTYVPPSNIIGETGIHALMNQLPDLKVLAGLYVGNRQTGDLVQEFEFDSMYEDLFHFPRITSGYDLDGEIDYFILNDALLNFGVFSHFIHPDDVLDDYRSKGRSWEEMKHQYIQLLDYLQEQHPQLEPYTTAQGRDRLISYLNSTLNVYHEKDQITIKGTQIPSPTHVFVRTREGKMLEDGEYEGYSVTSLKNTDNLYTVEIKKPYVTIKLKDEAR